jgi:hypothetical protein
MLPVRQMAKAHSAQGRKRSIKGAQVEAEYVVDRLKWKGREE